MTRFGYARVSTRDQNPDHQIDALLRVGWMRRTCLSTRSRASSPPGPQLDAMLGKLRAGDEVVVTRLKRIGRSQQHLLDLVRWFGDHGVDFVVLEQGIDTSTPGGRLVFHFLAALAEYDREMIVEGTLDGLAAARARGRVGGRPAALSQRQLDQAQRMYDSGEHTVTQIAATFRVGRAILYRHLCAHRDGDECVLVVYRNTRTRKVDAGTNRRYGETGTSERVQLDAGRKWFPIAGSRRSSMSPMASSPGYVLSTRTGPGTRTTAVMPVTKPLTEVQIAEQLPTLGLRLGDHRPHVRGKIREYLPL